MKWTGQRRAKIERRVQMSYAREARAMHAITGDPVYLSMAKIHVRMARAFNRHMWRGPVHARSTQQ